MSKRYREQLDEVVLEGQVPAVFRWRGRRYQVVQVLGHWYEDEGWWRRADGAPERIERTDLWRVEARNGAPSLRGVEAPRNPPSLRGVEAPRNPPSSRGVYELVRRGDAWRLDRVWD